MSVFFVAFAYESVILLLLLAQLCLDPYRVLESISHDTMSV